ncbi:MAG: diguanylate cyclase [Proteobacteria bacterium]|nr:diguanylate cyclase [Pseudomonadota bacterium]
MGFSTQNELPRVLFIDNEEQIRNAFAHMMKWRGFTVDVAASAGSAIALATKKRYKAIVTDISLPDMDGMDLIERLRSMQSYASFLVVTGCNNLDPPTGANVDEAITAIITKPWDSDDLEAKLREAIVLHDRRTLCSEEHPPTLLIVEDDYHSGYSVQEYFKASGFRTIWVRNGRDAIAAFQDNRVDVVLLDIMIPEIDGYSVCRTIKSDWRTRAVPVIFMTAKGAPEDKVLGFDADVDSYVTKPYDLRVLKAEVTARLKARQHYNALAAQTRIFRQLATIDELTELYSRRFFQDRLTYELIRAKRYKQDLSLLVVDVDHFKRANDTHGHLFGDMVLKQVADLIRSGLRRVDIPSRCGGDEFSIILPSTGKIGAAKAAERLRRLVQDHVFSMKPPARQGGAVGAANEHLRARITVTIGVATCVDDRYPGNQDEFVDWADKALYRAKSMGRNHVAFATARHGAWCDEVSLIDSRPESEVGSR